MLNKKEDFFLGLNRDISREIRLAREFNILSNELESEKNSGNKEEINKSVENLKNLLVETSRDIAEELESVFINASLKNQPLEIKILEKKPKEKWKIPKILDLLKMQNKYKLPKVEKETLRRLRKKEEEEKVEKKKIKKPNRYIGFANKLFSDFSADLIKKYGFKDLQIDIVKANMNFLLRSYLSVIILTTLVSLFAAVFLVAFLLFFEIGITIPFITLTDENIALRFLKTFWLILVFPTATLLFMYFYPSLEKDSIARKIELELPFATINMAAISGSLIDPTKMFNIIISTKEYPYLEKEFNKLLNTVNVLGQDFVSALRTSGFNTASKKLSDLFNGLSTTISSGGDLVKFFGERAETMLFEYNLEREKSTKAAETFMDIYISVVIAAPMILMLLLMMMRISGLGISLSTAAITLIMIMGVVGINIAFLVFLQLKQPNV